MNSPKIRKWLILLSIFFLIWIGLGYLFASLVTENRQKKYPPITSIGNFPAEQIQLTSSDGIKINSWFAGENKKQAVILLAGIGGNSSSMKARAEIYLQHGISVLLPDLRGTGISEGEIISFGWNEQKDLIAAYRWLRSRGFEKVGAHGCSLGAATIAYSLDSIPDYDFLVLESPYDNIDHAFAHRIFDSGFNRVLFWPAYFFTEQKTEANADELYPISRAPKYKGPLLYFAGDKEEQIPVEESRIFFTNFGSADKTFFLFPGAPHCDLCEFSPDLYKERLNAFIESIKQKP